MTTIEKNRLTELSLKKSTTELSKKETTELKALELKALKFKAEIKKKRESSHYGIQCLNNHVKAKSESKTLGFCIKFYLNTENTGNAITGVMLDYIKKVNTDSELYKLANKEVRRTKAGFLTPFYFLQWCTKQTNPKTKK